jgi:hypothetical protein
MRIRREKSDEKEGIEKTPFYMKTIFIPIVFVMVFCILLGGIYIYKVKEKADERKADKVVRNLKNKEDNAKKEQINKLSLIQTIGTIDNGYKNTKPMADLISNVWHDVIFGDVYQFELSAKYKLQGKAVEDILNATGNPLPYIPQGNLQMAHVLVLAYEKESGTLDKIQQNIDSSKTQVDNLKTMPKKYKAICDKIANYYVDMNSYVELAKQPQGNYEQYTSKMTDLSTSLQSQYTQLNLEIQ